MKKFIIVLGIQLMIFLAYTIYFKLTVDVSSQGYELLEYAMYIVVHAFLSFFIMIVFLLGKSEKEIGRALGLSGGLILIIGMAVCGA